MAQQELENQDQEFFLPWDVAFPFGLESPPTAASPPPPPIPLLPFSPFNFPAQSDLFDLPSVSTSSQIDQLGSEMVHPWLLGGVQVKEEVEEATGLVSQPLVAPEGSSRPLPDEGPPLTTSSSYSSYFLPPLYSTPQASASTSSSSLSINPHQFPFAFPYYSPNFNSNVATTSTSSNSFFLPTENPSPSPREEDSRHQRKRTSSSTSISLEVARRRSASQEEGEEEVGGGEVENEVVDEEKARKERRRATNRNSARAFRERQKAALDIQQSLLEERDAEVARLKAQLLEITQENLDLKRKLEPPSSSSSSD